MVLLINEDTGQLSLEINLGFIYYELVQLKIKIDKSRFENKLNHLRAAKANRKSS